MKPTMLALLAAATFVPSCVHAQTNTFTDVTVGPQFNLVLAHPVLDTHTNFFAQPVGAAGPMNSMAYGLGTFSFITSSPGQAQFEIDNLTFIFNGVPPDQPGGNGPVSLPFDITNDVTLENVRLSETFADGTTLAVLQPGTSIDTGIPSLFTTSFAYDPTTGDPTHGLLVSTSLTGVLDQTSLTIAQPAVVPEPGTLAPVAIGSLLITALAIRRRKQNTSA